MLVDRRTTVVSRTHRGRQRLAHRARDERFFANGLGVPACPQFGIVVQYAAAFCTLCLIATSPAFIPHCGRRLPSPAQNDREGWLWLCLLGLRHQGGRAGVPSSIRHCRAECCRILRSVAHWRSSRLHPALRAAGYAPLQGYPNGLFFCLLGLR